MNAALISRVRAGAVFLWMAAALGAVAGCSKHSGGGSPQAISQADAEKAVRERFDIDHFLTNEFIPKPGAPPPAPLSPVRKLRIGIYWVINDEMAPWFVGMDKGFFADEGLDLEIVEGGPGRDTMAQLVAGRLDLYMGSSQSPLQVITSPTGAELKMICAVMKQSPVCWLGLDGSTPKEQHSTKRVTAADLRGKKIGVQPGTDFTIDAVSDAMGLAPGELRSMHVGATPDALLAGSVDYFQAFADNQPRLLEKAGYFNWVLLPFADLGLSGCWDVSTVRMDFYKREPQLLACYVAALDKSMHYLVEHPEEAAEIVSRHVTNYPVTKAEELWHIQRDIPLYVGNGSEPLLTLNADDFRGQLAMLYRYHQLDLPKGK